MQNNHILYSKKLNKQQSIKLSNWNLLQRFCSGWVWVFGHWNCCQMFHWTLVPLLLLLLLLALVLILEQLLLVLFLGTSSKIQHHKEMVREEVFVN